MKKELSIVIGFAALWCAGIVLAPLFSGSVISDILYRMYSTICHQFGSRSFHIHNEPFAVCIRCTAIYFGFLTALILFRLLPVLRKKEFSALVLLFISGIPMALDGMLSFTRFYESFVLSRIVTGTLFGVGLAFILHRTLSEIMRSIIQKITVHYETKTK
ncbi:MAG: DUF2085 domain-containing protein [Ignavibacteriales bacterium]|nr:DUF2085 domain-containing protein [Ignavibacteriales bacterium]